MMAAVVGDVAAAAAATAAAFVAMAATGPTAQASGRGTGKPFWVAASKPARSIAITAPVASTKRRLRVAWLALLQRLASASTASM